MSNLEKDLLKIFWENEPLREAVRKALESKFEIKPNYEKSNQDIGENVRALWLAKDLVMEAFIEIESQINEKVAEETKNLAR